jgi:hypothetical protein
VPFSLFDAGNGVYILKFVAPEQNGTYSYKVTVQSVQATSTLKVNNLLFVVQYSASGIGTSTALEQLIYTISGNLSIGAGSDSSAVATAFSATAFNLSADVKDGEVFVFVTRRSGNVERVSNLLKDKTFLDKINPSFGYQIDEKTFVVYTNLEYGDIAVQGTEIIATGKYNLFIENKGYDTTLNKTKVEVRII